MIQIPIRTLLARIRVTGETMVDDGTGAFAEFVRADVAAMSADISRLEERLLTGLGDPREPYVPCPVSIGNDPCDDVSNDDECDY